VAAGSGQLLADEGRVAVNKGRGFDAGALVFGLIVLGVGLYYFADKTLGIAMPDLDWDRIWPVIIIAVGVAIVGSNLLPRGKDEGNGQ
jgi:hypothetical protein